MPQWVWPRTRQKLALTLKQPGGPPGDRGSGRGGRGGGGKGGGGGIALDTANITIYKPAGSTSTHTFSHTVVNRPNQILVLKCYTNNALGRVPTSASFNGVALTQKVRADDTSQARADIWYLVNPAVGTFNMVVNFSGSVGTSEGFTVENYYHVHQTTPWGTANTNTGNSNGPATVDVSSAVGELVTDCLSWSGTPETPVVGGGQTEIVNTTSAGGTKMCSSSEPGATTVTMSWTKGGTTATWAIAGAPLRKA